MSQMRLPKCRCPCVSINLDYLYLLKRSPTIAFY